MPYVKTLMTAKRIAAQEVRKEKIPVTGGNDTDDAEELGCADTQYEPCGGILCPVK
jgi:hypothetical protein